MGKWMYESGGIVLKITKSIFTTLKRISFFGEELKEMKGVFTPPPLGDGGRSGKRNSLAPGR
jgi:hypothetical protein